MDFHQALPRLIGNTHQSFLRRLEKNLRKLKVPVTAEQFKMMSRLWQQDGLSQQQIAIYIGRNRSATGRMIDTLEEKGLIVRISDKEDRRLNLIYLTKQGKAAEEAASKAAELTIEQGLNGIDPKLVEQVKIILQNILQNLNQ